MWLSELCKALETAQKQIKNNDFGSAAETLRQTVEEITRNGLVACIKMEEVKG